MVERAEIVRVASLRYRPLPSGITDRDQAPGYPLGVLLSGHLEKRIADLELVLANAHARLAAIDCLQGVEPESAGAQACLAALRASLAPAP